MTTPPRDPRGAAARAAQQQGLTCPCFVRVLGGKWAHRGESIGGEGNAKGSLDGVGSKLKAEEVKAWLRTPKETAAKAKADRKPPMPAYPKEKLSDEDLEGLTAYLLSLKK